MADERRRLAVLSGHVVASNGMGQSPRDIQRWLVRDNAELREAIFRFFGEHADVYGPAYELSLPAFRALTMKRVKLFVSQGFFKTMDYVDDPLRFQAALECLAFCDYSMAIKSGVHFTLCGGTIVKLGTSKHHAAYLRKMDTLELPGCFGMTELGHGSNVMGIETTAVFTSANGGGFVLRTPSNEASKFWIGGAGETAKICCVFAQLTIHGKWEGPHVFVVRLRDDHGMLMPNVRIKDNGPKQGLNGVDNGQIWLDDVWVPLDALLDRYATVDVQGRYSSPIADPATRFGTMISGLTTGRMLIAQAAVDACKSGVTIALRYSCARPQFGSRFIIEYITQQRRIFPALATTYAMHLALGTCKNLGLSGKGDPKTAQVNAKQVHVLSSGLKAAATWHRVRILQDCRECCGGMGFLAINKIGPMLNDMNVDVTFEGDNTVMMQQVSKALMDAFGKERPTVAVPVINQMDIGPGCAGKLLKWREQILTRQAAEEASAGSYEGVMDIAVAVGWAWVDAVSYATFRQEIRTAPAAWREPLERLCLLYGLCSVENHLATYLEHGVLQPRAVPVLRRKINDLCGYFAKDGAAVALGLCDGFGIPSHLLQAPIALGGGRGGWHDIGLS